MLKNLSRNGRHCRETFWPPEAAIQWKQINCRQHFNGNWWFLGIGWVCNYLASFTFHSSSRTLFLFLVKKKEHCGILMSERIAPYRYMYYFSKFGYIEESWSMILGFLGVSLAAALVESHPLSTEIDDNLTVPLASLLVGICLF